MNTFADGLFEFACSLNRAQTKFLNSIPDSPARTAPPDESGVPFSELPERRQLDILESLAARSKWWKEVCEEALAESDEAPALVCAALDSCVTAADLGNRLRETIIAYAERHAAINGDDLSEL